MSANTRITEEPRFLIIDLHKNKAVPATTDEMQALLRRDEPLTGEAYFECRKGMGYDPDMSSNLLVSDHEFTSRT